MKWEGKFIKFNIFLIKFHSKVSYAFHKSIFNRLLGGQCFLPYYFTISWHIRILCITLPLHNGTLRRTNNVTKNQFESVVNQFSNAFIQSMTTSDWFIVTCIVWIRDHGNEVNNSSVPSLKKLSTSENFFNCINYIYTNDRQKSLIEFAIVSKILPKALLIYTLLLHKH